jgi:hypothetical protein
MSQDKEAIIVLGFGILLCLIIVVASYSMNGFAILIIGQWNERDSAVQIATTVDGLEGESRDNLLDV